MNRCPTEDRLQLLIDGELPPTQFEPVEAHVEHCSDCQSTLDRLTAFADTAWLAPRVTAIAQRISATSPSIPGLDFRGEVGRGGQGVVYRAWQSELDRFVAVKLLKGGAFSTPNEQDRFLVETRAAGRLAHPNIVRVFSVSETGGIPFCVMEWVDGGTLAARLAGTPLPPREAAAVVATIGRGIAHAHGAGVIHRDLKPANVLLHGGTLARPVVSDFGMAKRLDAADSLTQTAAVLGTPSYIAPEVAAGGYSRDTGPAVDIYAMGAILYECLTGRPPFKGETPFHTLLQVRDGEIVPPRRLVPTIPSDLETVCLKCLRKTPSDRYHSAAALSDDLDRFLEGRPISARPPRLRERLAAWTKRRPRLVWSLGIGTCFLLAAIGLLWWSAMRVRAAEDEAKAQAMASGIASANTGRVPELNERLGKLRPLALPHLRGLYERSAPDSRERLNLALALLPDHPDLSEELARRSATARPEELLVIRETLLPHAATLSPQMWALALNPETEFAAVLRTATLLAKWEPNDIRWGSIAGRVTEALLAENLLDVGNWATGLRPVRWTLVPALAEASRSPDRADGQRTAASAVIADFARDDPELLAGLLVDATPGQFAPLIGALRSDDEKARARLRALADSPSPPTPDETGLDLHADRVARAAIALFLFGERDRVWVLLGRNGLDQRQRTAVIHALPSLGVPPDPLIERFSTSKLDHEKRGLIQALGGYESISLGGRTAGRLREILLPVLRDDPDPGLHAAAGWLLRTRLGAGEAVAREEAAARGKSPGPRRWSVGAKGMPMAHFEATPRFMVGTEDLPGVINRTEWRLACRIPYPFSVATREVTVREFAEFDPGHRPEGPTPQPDEPVRGVTWYRAVAYCRWLSAKEEIPESEMCYPPPEKLKAGVQFDRGFIARTGYRLPTEFEWEYVSRAGTDTPRSFGFAPALLDRYAWFLGNRYDRPGPVAVKRPNDFGLFDTLGNAWEWTHPLKVVHSEKDDTVSSFLDDPGLTVNGGNTEYCPVARGGSFLYHSPYIRSATRYPTPPDRVDSTIGFRVARTLKPGK